MAQRETNATTGTSTEVFVVSTIATIGRDLERARAHKNLTLEEAAKRSGLSSVWLRNLEKGKLRNASLKSLVDVAAVYELKLSFHL